MNVPRRVEIPSFPDGKRIAVTVSFDDGHIHDRRIVESFNRWGLKATFNLNSGLLSETREENPEPSRGRLAKAEIAELFQGHEVAIHTVSHPHLTKLDGSQIAAEILDDRKALEDLVGYPVRGMAYPFGSYDARTIEVLRSLGIVYSRTCENSPSCFPPREPLAWASTAHQFANAPTVPERFQVLLANTRYSGVFFIWGHGFEFHDQQDWDALERIYRPLAGHAEVWYCTNIELFDYEEARRRLIVAANRVTAYNPSALPVTVKADERLISVPPGQVVRL